MTTAAQVKNMVRPLLARHADLALVGRWLYVKPVHHFARAVLIDSTVYADEFEPRWAVLCIYLRHRSSSRWIGASFSRMSARAVEAFGSCPIRTSNDP